MDFEKYRTYFNENNTAVKELGMKITKLKEGYAEGCFVVEKRHLNVQGTLQGGMYYVLADAVAGVASKSYGNGSVTLEGNMNFLRSGQLGQTIRAIGKTVHIGRKTGVFEVNVYNDSDELLAVSRYSYFILNKPIEI